MAATNIRKKRKNANGKVEGLKMECVICHEEKSVVQNFYKSDLPEYSKTGYCNVCKECFKDLIINPETGHVDKDKFRYEVCKMLDMPFIPYEYAALMNDPKTTPTNFLGNYKKRLNVNNEYKKLHYEDSIKFDNDKEGLLKNKENPPDQITQEMIEFWGRGFTPEYYIDVQKRYDDFMKYEDPDKMDYKKISDYRTLCQLERKKTEMFQDKDAKPQDIKSLVDSISKLSEDLNIKTLQKKNDESDTGHYIIGLVTKYIEDVKMTPIPKLEDIDWLGEMPKSEFDIEMAYFKSEMLNELNRLNPYQDIVDEDKEKFSPTKEELDIARYADSIEDEEYAET